MALLASFRDRPEAIERIKAGLTHANADVRRAAARVIAATGLRQLVSDALTALANESDPETAVELAGAVIYNSPQERDAEVVTTVKTLGSEVLRRVGLQIAWARRAAALPRVDELGRTDEGDYSVEYLAVGGRGSAALNTVAVRALRDRNGAMWRAVVQAIDWSTRPLDNGLIRTGLTQSADSRTTLLWGLAQDGVDPFKTDSRAGSRRTVHTLARETADSAAAASPDAALALALLGRLLGEPAKDDPQVLEALEADAPLLSDRYLSSVSWSIPLTDAESSAIQRRAKRIGAVWIPASRATTPAGLTPPATVVRTVGGFPSGLVQDMLRLTGCKASVAVLSVAVTYDLLGRIVAMGPRPNIGSPACERAFEALARVSLQGNPRLVGPQEQLVLPLRQEFLTCLGAPEAFEPARLMSGPTAAAIVAPRKTRDVRPEYPQDAIKARVAGTVLLSTRISAAGCVKHLELVSDVFPSVNSAALWAVLGWRFRPAEQNGIRIPVVMTVSVAFTLE